MPFGIAHAAHVAYRRADMQSLARLVLSLVIGAHGFCPAIAQDATPFPTPPDKKGLQVQMVQDAIDLGIHHAAVNVSLGALFQIAIEKAGSLDRDKVRDELAKLDVVTFFGSVKFGANGQINSLEPPVFQIQAGKPVVLFPDAIKQGEFKLGVN